MEKLIRHFQHTYQLIVSDRTAGRLAETVGGMGHVDPGLVLGVMGSDEFTRLPRRIDVTVSELRAALKGRRHVA